MVLTSGAKLGAYEIVSPLGEGGMGEVYRARDTRLDRTVAIKVLPGHLAESPEAQERFDREARAISALNHARICTLYDVGHQDGTSYLVMEYLEGQSLAERLAKGALPLKETLRVGIEICEALEFAHRSGIVHRDLKPGNIMLTPRGAKLMDFGLAKPLMAAARTASSGAPPSFTAVATGLLSPLTTAGSIIGTVQYMSPEQIEGKDADARSDIFSLGSVLYEMAAGKRPFEGKSQLSLASAILERDPEPISAVKPTVPPAFEHAVTTCLQKDPEQRFQTAHDVKLELQWVAGGSSSGVMSAMPLAAPRRHMRVGWFLALLAALAFGVVGGWVLSRSGPPPQVTRTVINPPEKTSLSLGGDSAGPPVLSPDGSLLAFTAIKADGTTAVWVRPMDSLEAHIVPRTENAIFPFWSPDSSSIGFFAEGKLKTAEVNGSSEQVLADAPFGRGGSWGSTGVIVYSPETQAGLMRIKASGGASEKFTTVDRAQHTSHRWPFFLPDGKHLLYLAINHDPSHSENNTLYYGSLDGRENRPLFKSQSNAIYAAGYLLFARNDQLLAQHFDPDSGKLSGEASPIARGVLNDASTWHMDASAYGDKLLVLANGGSGDWQLVWLDRTGKEIGTVAEKLSDLQSVAISPQGDRIALHMDLPGQNDIWVLDVKRGVRTRLTFGPLGNGTPMWSPDGKWIAYASDRGGHAEVFRKASDGSGTEELLHTDDRQLNLTQWTADGKYILMQRGLAGALEIWALPLEGERKPFLLVAHPPNGSALQARVSPNGKWVAYSSVESGNFEVYVAAFRGQGKWQVSAAGGNQPRWSKDGGELYYMDPRFNLFAVPVNEAGGALEFGGPQKLVTTWSAPQVFYDVSPDGKKILLDRISQQVGQSVTVVSNYGAGMKK
jgi:serine/threonine protein kinase/Tol biopolymer transport system component